MTVRWQVIEQDRTLRSRQPALRLAPGQTVDLDLGAAAGQPGTTGNASSTVTAASHRDTAWARRGWIVGHDQFAVGGRAVPGILPSCPCRGRPP